ncbi:MAG: hypothetical protein ACYTF1_01565 [Planctomycetota bacterium]|jgi:predicted Zn-ribbon and HTH transcriptional regulator
MMDIITIDNILKLLRGLILYLGGFILLSFIIHKLNSIYFKYTLGKDTYNEVMWLRNRSRCPSCHARWLRDIDYCEKCGWKAPHTLSEADRMEIAARDAQKRSVALRPHLSMMAVFFRLSNIPELLLFDDGEERGHALNRALCDTGFKGSFIVFVSIGIGLAIPVGLILRLFRNHIDSLPLLLIPLPLLIVYLPLFFYIFYRINKGAVIESLRRQLNEMGIPICVNCGYDLRGQKDNRCPECGTTFM